MLKIELIRFEATDIITSSLVTATSPINSGTDTSSNNSSNSVVPDSGLPLPVGPK